MNPLRRHSLQRSPLRSQQWWRAPASEPGKESDIPPVWHEKQGEREEVPHSDFPGWTEVLHPAHSATSAREIPPPPSELRWRCHSQSAGGRRAQCQKAEECRQAEQERLGSESSPGSPEPMPKVTPPLGFKGVVACLMRESPSPALHWNNPQSKAASYVGRACSDNDVCYPHSTGWGHWGYLHGHGDCLGGRVALRIPHMAATLPGATVEDIAEEDLVIGYPWMHSSLLISLKE